MKWIILTAAVFFVSGRAEAFGVQIFGQAAARVAASADAFEDLASAIDDESQFLKDIQKFQGATSDVRQLLSETDGVIGDIQYVLEDVDSDFEWTTKMHIAASKIRTAKSLARKIAMINADPEVATAVETSKTNMILSNMINDKRNQRIQFKERAYQRFVKRAKTELQMEKSIERALVEMQNRQKHSNLVFSPFNHAKMPTLKYRIQDLYLKEMLGQGTASDL